MMNNFSWYCAGFASPFVCAFISVWLYEYFESYDNQRKRELESDRAARRAALYDVWGGEK